MNETQKTITAWGDAHYPNESISQRYCNLIEEVAELGAALGIPHGLASKVLEISYLKSASSVGNAAEVAGEIGDVDISLMFLASGLGIEVAEATDAKMGTNRLRSIEESGRRKARKQELGLRGGKIG